MTATPTASTNLHRVPHLRRFFTFTWITLGIAVAVMVVFAFVQSSIVVDTLVTGGMWALLAAGLALVFGVMNIPNFAHGEFFMIGSLAAYFVFSPIQDAMLNDPSGTGLLKVIAPFPGMVVAAIIGFAVGALLEVLLFRPLRKRSRDQWVMNTFLLTAGVSTVLINGDMLGYFDAFTPKFVKKYADFHHEMQKAFADYIEDVETKHFPAPEHTVEMDDKEWAALLNDID